MEPGSQVEQAPSGPERMIVEATYPGWSTARLFECWVRPELLRAWWPPEAQVEPTVGGAYQLEWPRQGWTLRGRYVEFDPGRALAFTWRWDHDPPEVPEMVVRVTFAGTDEPAGARLRVEHGTYPATAQGQEWRQSHLDGWLHFLVRLGEVTPTRGA